MWYHFFVSVPNKENLMKNLDETRKPIEDSRRWQHYKVREKFVLDPLSFLFIILQKYMSATKPRNHHGSEAY